MVMDISFYAENDYTDRTWLSLFSGEKHDWSKWIIYTPCSLPRSSEELYQGETRLSSIQRAADKITNPYPVIHQGIYPPHHPEHMIF